MKRLFLLALPMALAGILAACGSTDQNQTQTDSESDTSVEETADNQKSADTGTDTMKSDDAAGKVSTTEDQEVMKADMEKLDFTEIELDVSYGQDKEYEAGIEQDANQPIEAKVEDELNNQFSSGKEAFDLIYSKAKNLTLSSESPKQKVIDQVLKEFNLPDDYQKLEVEITFNDGSKLDLEDRK